MCPQAPQSATIKEAIPNTPSAHKNTLAIVLKKVSIMFFYYFVILITFVTV
jgi:hypothetical protein